MSWEVEVAVVDPQSNEMTRFFSSGPEEDGEKFATRDEAVKYGVREIRKYYKTSWSTLVEDSKIASSTVYTDGAGVIGFVNVWEVE